MSDDVLVACKLPHGVYIDVGKERIKLNGILQTGRFEASFFMPAPNSVGLTRVPRDFWEAWLVDHQEFAPVKKGLIFASDKKKRVLDEANEKADLKHGLERIDPKKMPKTLQQIEAGQVV